MKLSIITINYNNLNGLKKTVESVISQTYLDFEYIIIDGASTDGSKEVIEKNSDRFSYWVSENDHGIYNAMNKGILKAKGDYLLFLNSGDWFIDAQILENTISSVKDADIVYADGYIENENGLRTLIKIPEEPGLSFFSKTSLFHPSSFIKRELFEKYGLYNEDNKIVSDWEFFIKTMLINKVSYKKIPTIISVIEENGISRNPSYAGILKDEIRTTLARYFTEEELASIFIPSQEKKVLPEKKAKIITRLFNLFKN